MKTAPSLAILFVLGMAMSVSADVGLVEVSKKNALDFKDVLTISVNAGPQKERLIISISGPRLPDSNVSARLVLGDVDKPDVIAPLQVIDRGGRWLIEVEATRANAAQATIEVMLDSTKMPVAAVYRVAAKDFVPAK